ncbi:MAG TPA: hypothetical protein VKQ32_15610 [Polyangia bacterium]|nr:hypothetical protein [Polyangia bacterium]
MSATTPDPCTPNISAAGRRRRRRFGLQFAGLSVAATGAGLIFQAPWAARAAVFFPAAISAIGYLQANRNTCVMRARQGTLEHDDFSTEPAPAVDVAASRQVAKSIYRDAVLVGVAAAAIAVATALIR